MNLVVEEKKGFKLIGFQREFSSETSYQEIPKFWTEFHQNYPQVFLGKTDVDNSAEKLVYGCRIGEYGVCISDLGEEKKFRYLIAGHYDGDEVPEGMTTYEFPDLLWARFICCGPLPGALQDVNTEIFTKWLPENPDYEAAFYASIEWYGEGDPAGVDYRSEIWLPVRKKQNR